MTEEEWLAGPVPFLMLDFLEGKVSDRKMQLVAVAFCRRIRNLINHEQSWQAVLLVERFADGMAEKQELAAVGHALNYSMQANTAACCACWVALTPPGLVYSGGKWEIVTSRANAMSVSLNAIADFVDAKAATNGNSTRAEDHAAEEAAHVSLIRCVFGNPSRTVAFDAGWRTSDVMRLAQSMYDERAFDRMPILADALQDAGCDSDDILNHLRDSTATHVRGCWALDLVLGKQ